MTSAIAGAGIDRDADVGEVRVEHVLHRHLVRGEDAHERLLRVGRAQRALEIGRTGATRDAERDRGEDPAADGDEHRRERDRAARARVAEHGLLDLRDVLVTAEAVGAQVVLDLHEAVVLGCLPASARHAGQARDDDPLRRDDARLHERRDGERDRRRVAPRVRDEPGAGEPRARELGEPVARLGEELGRGVREPVPGRVVGGIGEPERAGEVHHAGAAGEELRREPRGHVGRRRQEDDLALGVLGLGEREVAQRRGGASERQARAGGLLRPAVRVQLRHAHVRVAREEPRQLEAGVAGRPDDRGRMDMHERCINMQHGAVSRRGAPGARRPLAVRERRRPAPRRERRRATRAREPPSGSPCAECPGEDSNLHGFEAARP